MRTYQRRPPKHHTEASEDGQSLHSGGFAAIAAKFTDLVGSKAGKAIGAQIAALKLTGNVVSAVHARNINSAAATVFDVTELKIPASVYKLIDGAAIAGDQLRLEASAAANKWRLRLDRAAGDVVLTFTP